jgi:hypothetical protein
MSVAAWVKTLQAPTAEEAAITEEQILSRTSWDAPDAPADTPAFIGTGGGASTWVRTDRPEDAGKGGDAPGRPARAAAQPAATGGKTYMGADLVWKLMDADRTGVFDAAKAQLNSANCEVPDTLIAEFVVVKKTASAVANSTQNYKKWANLIDYETLAWDRIERELERGLFHVPQPFLKGANDSVTFFVNSNAFEPRSGSRQIVGTLWLIVHYVLAKSEKALPNGISIVFMGDGFSYSKFYPAIQRALLDSLQSVLPVRIAGIHIVDPPYIFKVLWGIVSGWLTEKMRERVFILSSSNIGKHFDKAQTPTFAKGDHPTQPTKEWDDVKAFYHKEFLPTMLSVADAPGSGKAPELWEPKASK